MNDLAIKISHVSKEYRLGMIGGATLREELQSKFARLRGKEDPNLKIGQKAHTKNERFLALDDISLEIRKGERVGIIGHNGAGKSTLLKLICRVTTPTTGEICMNGRITSMLEVGTGFHGELTGRENVYLNGAILGLTKAEIAERFDKIVEFSEVGQFIDTPVKRYSSGMHVKLGFAVASHLDSEIMIMDEVLAVGDMAFQKKCIDRMRLAAEDEGRTILYVSHNMQTIRQLCSRCIVMEHGKIVFDGDPDKAIEIYMPKANEEAYQDIWHFDSLVRPAHLASDDFRIESFIFAGIGGFEIPAGTQL
ncbi:MAG: ABC transporter ATP-binding protein, partial [Clostridia bacterium]|nr:ABC transporter ATP-binding protein [Clostridia bacterium]